MELVFAQSHWIKIYTLESFSDLIYRFHDLKPWAIVIDEKQIPVDDKQLVDFLSQAELKIIHVADPHETLLLEQQSIGRLNRILKPMDLERAMKDLYIKHQ